MGESLNTVPDTVLNTGPDISPDISLCASQALAPTQIYAPVPTPVHPEPLYLCAYVPEFPTQALLRLRHDLARSAVAVLAGDPPLEQVCSFSAAAVRLGVAHGMTRAELETFPGLALLHRSLPEEHSTRAALLEAAGAFTPRLEVQPAASSGNAFCFVLDMTGTTRIFGPPAQAAARLAHSLRALRLHVQIAGSANLHAAACLAASACRSPLLVAAGHERESLRGLPLAALNLTPEQAETLSLWGLHTLGELAELPETELISRLGQAGKRLRLLARGEHPHLLVPEEPVFTLEEFVAFDSPVELLDSLLFVLGPMLDQLLARAQNHALALASVTVRLRLDGGGEHERTVKPALPVAQREILLKLLQLDLQAHPPSAGVVSIAMRAEPGDRSKVQLGLFAVQLPEPVRLEVTLARIAALVGEDRVGQGRLLDTHRPDSFVLERFTVPTGSATPTPRSYLAKPERFTVSPGSATPTPRSHLIAKPERFTVPAGAAMPAKFSLDTQTPPAAPVALRRCRPPVPLSVQRERSRPRAFSLHGKRYAVQEAYGPWRRSGDWWTATVWSCEEWDVRATAGPADVLLGLLTHNLLSQQWQLEALYD